MASVDNAISDALGLTKNIPTIGGLEARSTSLAMEKRNSVPKKKNITFIPSFL